MKKIAEQLYAAEQNRKCVKRFTAAQPDFSLAQGYQVQRELLALHQAQGAKLVGRKMGMTSRPKMQQMGIHSPIHGFLTSRMQVPEGGFFSLGRGIHPKVEPEIAFLLDRELAGRPSLPEVFRAVGGVMAALEIIDSRYENFEFQLPDVVADNCSSSGFVLGPLHAKGQISDLANLGMVLEQNGKPMQFGSSAAILGNPLRSLTDLVHLLDAEGTSLPAGAVVLAGGATAAIPLAVGQWIRVQVQELGSVEFRVQA